MSGSLIKKKKLRRVHLDYNMLDSLPAIRGMPYKRNMRNNYIGLCSKPTVYKRIL